MTGILSKENIIDRLHTVSGEFVSFCSSVDNRFFFYQPPIKWSIAQNIKHLTISVATTKYAFSFPKLILRLYVGTPNRISRTYDELVTKYKLKLEQGGKAGKRFVPKPSSQEEKKEKMLGIFLKVTNKLVSSIEKKWNDAQLDQYIAPHPLLGKITLRELCYFTIYHTEHRLNIIKERLKEYRTLP